MSIDHAELEEFRRSLAADGYELDVDVSAGSAAVRIVAGPDACDDCLVSKSMMRSMLAPVLGVAENDIDLTYPADHGAEEA
ncbi:MAG: hypothetical protein ACOC96_10865 [Actinomycetota bacterium]